MLTGLHIQNYRQFRDFKVEGLKRFNLIVGDNGVGKSALLEAVWLLVNEGDVEVALDLLFARGEFPRPSMHKEAPDDFSRSPLSTLTLWPPQPGATSFTFEISNVPPTPSWTHIKVNISAQGYRRGIVDILRSLNMKDLFDGAADNWVSTSTSVDSNIFSGDRVFQSRIRDGVYILTSGLDKNTIQSFWDRITLTEAEDDIDQALQLLDPTIQRVSLTSTGPVVKLKGAPAPVPLRRLGEGMGRLFALALGMVNAKGGVMLIDEIETGLHRGTQARMWPFLFTLARRLDVQLFATTHSWDCIATFAEAAKDTPNEVALVRLERFEDDVRAVRYDESELLVASAQGIEVR